MRSALPIVAHGQAERAATDAAIPDLRARGPDVRASA